MIRYNLNPIIFLINNYGYTIEVRLSVDVFRYFAIPIYYTCPNSKIIYYRISPEN